MDDVAADDEKIFKLIGEYNVQLYPPLNTDGAFGQVFEAFHYVTGSKCAVKCIKFRDNEGKNEEMAKLALKEIKSIQCFKDHKHIVQYVDYYMDHYSYWLFMEFCELGDLEHYLTQNPDLTLPSKVNIMHQISDAIAFMHGHSTPLVHRDIKLKNILMQREGDQDVAKVSDFGLSKLFENAVSSFTELILQGQFMKTHVGTASYMAPEFFMELKDMRYDASIDVFALGLLFSVILRFNPSSRDTLPKSVKMLKSGQFVNIGYEMWMCHQKKEPQPQAVEHCSSDTPDITRLKTVVTDMVKFKREERKAIHEVKQILQELNDTLSKGQKSLTVAQSTHKEMKKQLDGSLPYADEAGYQVMRNFSRDSTFVNKLLKKTYTKEKDSTQVQAKADKFSKYDLVLLIADKNELEKLQKGYGGYHPEMDKCLGQRGLVTGILQKGIRVDVHSGQCFIFNPEALSLITSHKENIEAGDYVIVKPNEEFVKKIQEEPGNGGWRKEMSQMIGQLGIVRAVRGGTACVDHLTIEETFIWAVQALAVVSKAGFSTALLPVYVVYWACQMNVRRPNRFSLRFGEINGCNLFHSGWSVCLPVHSSV